jgi:hypothetical protein
LPIFNLISQRGWGSPSKWRASGRAIIKLSKKEPCVVHGLSVFFVLPRASKNLASRQKKKLEENSGPDPLLSSSVKGCSSPSQDWRRQPRRPSSPEEGDIDRRCFSPPALKMLCSVFMCFESVQANFSLDTFGGHIGAFLKTQRHKNMS